MSSKRRARRMARNNKRLARPTKLNLVALMDIFTILVLFLIVNNGDVEVLQEDNKVALPESVSEQRPEATVIIKITDTDILLADRRVGTIDEALETQEGPLAGLSAALDVLASNDEIAAGTESGAENNTESDAESDAGRPITIMGHRDTPYAVLKRIMSTCAESDYRDISLAVNSVPVSEAAEQDAALAKASGLTGGEL
jgi:biopolymer transport protein ExbD